jgi:hypothetical protein
MTGCTPRMNYLREPLPWLNGNFYVAVLELFNGNPKTADNSEGNIHLEITSFLARGFRGPEALLRVFQCV